MVSFKTEISFIQVCPLKGTILVGMSVCCEKGDRE